MVLKNILIIFSIALCVNLKAQMTDKEKSLISEMQLALDKNQDEKVEDIYDENENLLSKNRLALERLALSFERREKFMDASKIYKRLITQFFNAQHVKIMSMKDLPKIDPRFYNETRLSYYYYKMAFLFVQQYKNTTEYTVQAEKEKLFQLAMTSINFAAKVTEDDTEVKILKENLLEKEKSDIGMKYQESWYTTFAFTSWQDNVFLINDDTKAKTKLISTNIGACLGGGKKWENVKYEFNIDACFFSGTSSISSTNSVQYEQSKVSVMAIFAGPGVYFKALSPFIKIGVQLPFMYRSGDWELPKDTGINYKFDKNKLIGAGPVLTMKVQATKFNLITKFGKVFPNPSSLWSIGVGYDF